MTKIWVKIIKNTRNGKEEVFRTTKPGYVPEGWVLVKDLYDFTIGGPSPYEEQKKEAKKSNTAIGCGVLAMAVFALILLLIFFSNL